MSEGALAAMPTWTVRNAAGEMNLQILIWQGRPGTARNGGPGDLWHGTARKIMARKILARHGTENIGTEK